MDNSKLTIDALISHRFRGFSKRENTLEGLKAALDFGVVNLEFDVRVAACGTPVIYHDEYALDKDGKRLYLCDYKAASFQGLGGRFPYMPSLEDLLALVSAHANTKAKLLIDIKDYGFEHEIHALVMLYKLQKRTIYVSWLPDVLYRLQELAPTIPKCFSHWCQNITAKIAAKHHADRSLDGHIAHTNKPYIHGIRTGWAVGKPIVGDMLDVLQNSNGGICVPESMITRDLRDYYNSKNLFVSTYSYTDWKAINAHKNTLGIDLYFIDNKRIFDDVV